MLSRLTTAVAARRESRAGSARNPRGFRTSSALGALALIVGLTTGGTAPAAVTTLYATVGPSYTITLTDAAGAAVTELAPGDYTIVVDDQSASHNFHLTGPGPVDRSTTVEFVGQETWAVTLVAGSYSFVCDPHADGMFGNFTVVDADTTAPDTTITSGPAGTVGATSASFTFESTEAGSSFECALDGAAFAPCTSPASYSGLANGGHRFEVRATDAAGNVDATPAGRSWTIDASALYATVGPGYTISLTDAAGVAVTELTSGTYTIVVNDQSASHNFHLSGPGPVDRSTTVEFVGQETWAVTLVDGSYSFVCDPHADGMFGSFTVTPPDTTAPDTTITSGPAGTVGATSASFAFEASEAGSSFACALDGAAFAPCTSPASYSGLANGGHSFEVRATDAAGNVDATPAGRSWTIDTNALYATVGPSYTITLTDAAGAPVTSLEAGTYAIVVDDRSASHNFHLSGPGVERATTVEFIGQETWTVTLFAGSYSFICDPHADGMFGGFTVVDTTAPETTIDTGPSGSVNTDAGSFSFSASEPGSRFECSLDGVAFAPCTSPVSFSGLGDGPHSFQVRATDAAGNADPTPASAGWAIDTVVPETTIDAGPSGTVGATSVSFSFSASEAGARFECALDGAPFAACSSPAGYSGLADGTHSFEVRAADAAGNLDASPAGRTFTIDTRALYATVGPSYTITLTDAAGAPVTTLEAGTYAIVVDDRSTSHNFHLSGPGVERATTVEFIGQETWTVTLVAGTYSFVCDPHADGMFGGFSVVDTTQPETTIDTGPSGSVNTNAGSFSFSASEPGSTFECALDGATFAACSPPVSLSGLADGPHTFQVRATDSAGNADPTPAERTWTVDTAAPETTIETGPSGTVGATSASFSFSASEAGARFECALDGAPFAACSSPASYSGLAEGAHSFEVRATDDSGNTDATPATRTWTVDTPTTTITAASFEFSSDHAGATFECALDGAAFSPCTSPQSYTGLANGSHSFVVRAIDAAGNPGQSVSDFSWRVEAPQQQQQQQQQALGGHR